MMKRNIGPSPPPLHLTVFDAINYLVQILRDQPHNGDTPLVKLELLWAGTGNTATVAQHGDLEESQQQRQPSPDKGVPSPSPATHSSLDSTARHENHFVRVSTPAIESLPTLDNAPSNLPDVVAQPSSPNRSAATVAKSAALHHLWNQSGRQLPSSPPRKAPGGGDGGGGGGGGARLASSPRPQQRASAGSRPPSPMSRRPPVTNSPASKLLQAAAWTPPSSTQHVPQENGGVADNNLMASHGNPEPWHSTVKVQRDAYGIIVESPRSQWFKTRTQRRRQGAAHLYQDGLESGQLHHHAIVAGAIVAGSEFSEKVSDVSVSDDDEERATEQQWQNFDGVAPSRRRGAPPQHHHGASRMIVLSPSRTHPVPSSTVSSSPQISTTIERQHDSIDGVALRHEAAASVVAQQHLDPQHHMTMRASKQISPRRSSDPLPRHDVKMQLYQIAMSEISNAVATPRAHATTTFIAPAATRTIHSVTHYGAAQKPPLPLSPPQTSKHTPSMPVGMATASGAKAAPVVSSVVAVSANTSTPPIGESPRAPSSVVTPTRTAAAQVTSPPGLMTSPLVEPYQLAMRHPLLQQYVARRQ